MRPKERPVDQRPRGPIRRPQVSSIRLVIVFPQLSDGLFSGNGRPDYLCMEKDGRTKGYLHNSDGSFDLIPQFKKTDNFDRANYRWADVNGKTYTTRQVIESI